MLLIINNVIATDVTWNVYRIRNLIRKTSIAILHLQQNSPGLTLFEIQDYFLRPSYLTTGLWESEEVNFTWALIKDQTVVETKERSVTGKY